MDWETTSTILDGLRDYRNSDAWANLAARFRKPIVHFARQLGLSDSDAEDVAQETLSAFADAYRNGRYDRRKGALSRWLFGIAYRQALRERRMANRTSEIAQRAHSDAWNRIPDEQSASESWDREWEEALMSQCLEHVAREVEPTTMRAFQLVVGEERPPAEVADLLGVTVKTVYNAKHRVLKRLRELRERAEIS